MRGLLACAAGRGCSLCGSAGSGCLRFCKESVQLSSEHDVLVQEDLLGCVTLSPGRCLGCVGSRVVISQHAAC